MRPSWEAPPHPTLPPSAWCDRGSIPPQSAGVFPARFLSKENYPPSTIFIQSARLFSFLCTLCFKIKKSKSLICDMQVTFTDSPSTTETLPRQRKPSPLPRGAIAEEPATPEKVLFDDGTPILYDEIPEWYQDNEFIRYGYRPVSNSTHACFASWLYLHNESVNIYSHLVPAVFFLASEGMFYRYLQVKYPEATLSDHAIFAFFLLTAVICLGLSTTYHTLMNHSLQVSELWLRLDFVGIIVLTLGDFVSGIYMVFYCEPLLRRIYWGMVCSLPHVSVHKNLIDMKRSSH